jgi:hypothetical protein
MKKILFLFLILCFAFSSCGKKDSSVTIKNGLVCEIDGKQWSGDTLMSNIIKHGEFTVITSPKGNVSGKDYEILSILLKGELKTGDYELYTEGDKSHVEFNSTITKRDKKSDGEYDVFRSSEGKVKIVKFDENHVEGTFNFTLLTTEEPKKTLKVTDGKFNIKISK